MQLSKKKEKEFTAKIRQIKELEQQKKQTEESISEIKDEIKAFRNDNEELYAEYLRPVTTKRFSIT